MPASDASLRSVCSRNGALITIGGPKILSTSSMVTSYFDISEMVFIIPYVPMRLAMKLVVSLP